MLYVAIMIINVFNCILQIYCSGVLELQLKSFTNARGLDYDGNCCNGVLDTSDPVRGPMCSEPCHTFYTICLTNYMNNIPPDLTKEKCLFGYVQTDVLGSNNVNFETLEGFNSLITFHFNFSWPVSALSRLSTACSSPQSMNVVFLTCFYES